MMPIIAFALLQPPALDVRRFGARPDDPLDDTEAIQRTLMEARRGPRMVYIPPGVFIVSKMLCIPSRVTLFGSGKGSALKLADGANWDLLQNAEPERGDEGIVVRDLCLDGNKKRQGRPLPGAMGFFVIRFLRASECVFERLWIKDAPGDGISCWGGRMSTVTSWWRGAGDTAFKFRGLKDTGRPATSWWSGASPAGVDGIDLGYVRYNHSEGGI